MPGGVTAALVVQSGFTGVDDIFSGPDNYFDAYAPEARPELLIEQLGQRYEIARTNIKKWTVGSPIQAPLDAMSNIFAKHQVNPDDVKSIVVRLAHTEARTVNNREMPDNLPATHDRHDTARQDGVVQGSARQSADERPHDASSTREGSVDRERGTAEAGAGAADGDELVAAHRARGAAASVVSTPCPRGLFKIFFAGMFDGGERSENCLIPFSSTHTYWA